MNLSSFGRNLLLARETKLLESDFGDYLFSNIEKCVVILLRISHGDSKTNNVSWKWKTSYLNGMFYRVIVWKIQLNSNVIRIMNIFKDVDHTIVMLNTSNRIEFDWNEQIGDIGFSVVILFQRWSQTVAVPLGMEHGPLYVVSKRQLTALFSIPSPLNVPTNS